MTDLKRPMKNRPFHHPRMMMKFAIKLCVPRLTWTTSRSRIFGKKKRFPLAICWIQIVAIVSHICYTAIFRCYHTSTVQIFMSHCQGNVSVVIDHQCTQVSDHLRGARRPVVRLLAFPIFVGPLFVSHSPHAYRLRCSVRSRNVCTSESD